MNSVPKPVKRQKRESKSSSKKLKKQLDEKWSYLIKLIAGNKSEISGKSKELLNAHHILRKTNYVLRYSIKSGICLTYSEHYRYHFTSSCEDIRDKIKDVKGNYIFEELKYLLHHSKSVSLQEAKKYIDYHISIFEGKKTGQIYPVLEKGIW